MLIIALVATVWGFGFPMTRIVLDGGLSVGAQMGTPLPARRAADVRHHPRQRYPHHPTRRARRHLARLVLVVIFWLQSDGMRFTTTAKAGFITGLYVLFTPLVAVVIGQRVKLASALGAVIAVYGMYLLVHLPGGGWGGPWAVFREMNRGDIEILLCAFLCGVHIVMMGAFTRRSEAWILAGSQVVVCGVVSVVVTAFLPSPYGFQTAIAALSHWPVAGATLYLALGLHRLRLLGPGDRPDAPGPHRVGGAVQPGAGGGGDTQRGLAERADVAPPGDRWRAHRRRYDRRRSATLHVPRHHRARHKAVMPKNIQPRIFADERG